MNEQFQKLMREATELTQAGRLNEATAAIMKSLQGHAEGLPPLDIGGLTKTFTDAFKPASATEASTMVIDGCVVEVEDRPVADVEAVTDVNAVEPTVEARTSAGFAEGPSRAAGASHGGRFTSHEFALGTVSRRYKLYTPPEPAGRQLPLVVMLHGCTQNPDDFAAGTAMNELARQRGFYVLYPEQSARANPQRCWNWFKSNHQRRGSGEPGLLAGMTESVIREHGIDPRRVYVAGLSAGGAMTAILAAQYPDLFAAAGVHSGLAGGSASNAGEALAVMQSGSAKSAASAIRIPTIVFHGDQDHTVHPRNGEQVMRSVSAQGTAHVGVGGAAGDGSQPVVSNGRRVSREVRRDAAGGVAAEYWLVHGAGHAWSGGSSAGSYTDVKGPDASREMLRFFLEHPHSERGATAG